MLSACPRCGVHLTVSPTALRAARGLCRCGACRALFAAWAHLVDPPPAAQTAAGADAADDARPSHAPGPPVATPSRPRAVPAVDAPVLPAGRSPAPPVADPLAAMRGPVAVDEAPVEYGDGRLAGPSVVAAAGDDAATPSLDPGADGTARADADGREAPPSLLLRAVLDEDIATATALAGEPDAPRPEPEGSAPASVDPLPSTAPPGRLRDPDWVHAPPPRRRAGPRLLWRLALCLLLIALLVQISFMQAGALAAAWPPARPIIAQVWKGLGRPAPWRRDIDHLAVLGSDVRDHPHQPGNLRVTVTLQNGARFEQPFPAIELTLGDARGEHVGRRRFEPTTYLGADWPDPAFMPIGRPVEVLLELAGSHEGATAFTIELQAADQP